MGAENIGKQIAALRKERGIKQEELANFVGVSIQAVSKWENGGMPDTELLPKIADFFSVSIDTLFGRSVVSYANLQRAIIQKIQAAPADVKFKEAFSLCWDIERSLFPTPISKDGTPIDGNIENQEQGLGELQQIYSYISTNHGFTRMGIANRLQYFLLVPEIKDAEVAFSAVKGSSKYCNLFADLADPDFFNACITMYKRTSTNAFTSKLLMNACNLTAEKATAVLDLFGKYNLAAKTDIEEDNGHTQTIYKFVPRPSFIALMIFAREMIAPAQQVIYTSNTRTKPYLK